MTVSRLEPILVEVALREPVKGVHGRPGATVDPDALKRDRVA